MPKRAHDAVLVSFPGAFCKQIGLLATRIMFHPESLRFLVFAVYTEGPCRRTDVEVKTTGAMLVVSVRSDAV
ncbi:hypothetical protein CFE70_006454 [Pyrenophora teres f. teres 0-1]